MSNIFQTQLDTPQASQQVFKQVAGDPVDNGLATAINAVSALSKLGAAEYKDYQQNKVLKGVAAQMAKTQQAIVQGTLKPSEGDIRDGAYITSVVTAYPDLAPEVRNIGITIRGTDANAQIDAASRYNSEEERNRQSQAKQMFINSAAQSGFAPRKADGTFDQDAMMEFGAKEQERQYTISLINQKNQLRSDALTQQLKIRELNNVDKGGRVEARRTEFEKHVYENFAEQKLGVLQNRIGEFTSTVNQGKATTVEEQMLNESVIKGTEDSAMQLRKEALDAGLTSADADYFEAKFRNQADKFTKLFTGDKDLASRLSKNVSVIQSKGEMTIAKAYPIVYVASNSGIPFDKIAFDSEGLNTAEVDFTTSGTLTSITTDYTGESEKPTYSQLLNSSTQAIAYGKPFDSFSPKEQKGVFKAAEATLKEGLKAFDTTTPEHRVGITNSLGVLVKASNDLGNGEEDIVKFSNLFNRPQMKNALVKLNQDSMTSGKLQKIADERIQYVETIFSKIGIKNLNYNEATNKAGNPVADALLRDLETFFPYHSNRAVSFEAYKKYLLGIKDSSSTAKGN